MGTGSGRQEAVGRTAEMRDCAFQFLRTASRLLRPGCFSLILLRFQRQ